MNATATGASTQTSAERGSRDRTPSAPRLAVLASRIHGAPPELGARIDARLEQAARTRGYQPVPAAAIDAARQRVGVGRPSTPAELWQITYLAQADYGAIVRITPSGGAYSVQIEVAARDGSGPFFARQTASLDSIPAQAGALLASILPLARPPVPAAPPPTRSAASDPAADNQPKQSPIRTAIGPSESRWHLVAQTEAAFGVSHGFFYNHVIGGRLDYRFAPRVRFGGFVGYVNIEGKSGRGHNALAYAQIDYRLPLSDSIVQIPFRAATGYFPKNGPFAKATTGIGFQTEGGVDIVLELLAPALWLSNDLTVLSLDAGLEVGYAF